MAARADELRDFGPNDPKNWVEPFGSGEIHIVVSVFSDSEQTWRDTLETAQQQYQRLGGVSVLVTQDFGAQPGDLNPLGYKDCPRLRAAASIRCPARADLSKPASSSSAIPARRVCRDVGQLVGGDGVAAFGGVVLAREDRCPHGRRAQHTHADSLIDVGGAEPFGEADRGVLGDRVGHGVVDDEQARRGGDVEQVAAALPEHVRDRVPGREHLGQQIDADDLLPVVGGRVDASVDDDARVRDEEVDPSEALDRGGDQVLDVLPRRTSAATGNAPIAAPASCRIPD
jgi:hypothetical protein